MEQNNINIEENNINMEQNNNNENNIIMECEYENIEDNISMTGNYDHTDDIFDLNQEDCEYCDGCDYCKNLQYIREYYNYLPENDDYLKSYREDENGDYLE
jgi:hypothetical protein